MKNPPPISDVVGLRMGHGENALSGDQMPDDLAVQKDTPPATNSPFTTSNSTFLEHGSRTSARAKFPPGCPVVYLSSSTSITSGKVLSATYMYSKSSNEHIVYTILPATAKHRAPSTESALTTVTVPQASVHFHPSCPIRIDLSNASHLAMPDATVISEGVAGARLLLEKSEILAGYARTAATGTTTGTDDLEDTNGGARSEEDWPKSGIQWAYSIRITLKGGRIVTYHGVDESLLCYNNSSSSPNNDDGINETILHTQDSNTVTEGPSRQVTPKVVPPSAYSSKSAAEDMEKRAKKMKKKNIAHIRRIDIPSELVTPKYNLIAQAKRYLANKQGLHLADLIRDLERRVLCRVFLYDQAAKKQSAQHVSKLCGDLSPRHDDVCVFLRARDAPTADWGADTMVRIFADSFGRDPDDARYLERRMFSSVCGTTMEDARFEELPPSLEGIRNSDSASGRSSNLSGSVRTYDDTSSRHPSESVTTVQSNKRSKTDHSYPAGTVHIRRIDIPNDLNGKALRTAILGSDYSINSIESDLKCRISFFHDRKKNIRWDDMAKSFDSLCPTHGDLCVLVRGWTPAIVDNACDVMIRKIVKALSRRRRYAKDLEQELVSSIRTATVIDGGFTEPISSTKALISRIDLPDWLDKTEVASGLIGPRGRSISRLMKVSNCNIKVKGQGVRDIGGDPDADTLFVTFEGDTEEKMSLAYELVQSELLKHIDQEQHDRLLYDLEASCNGYRTASLIAEGGGPTVYQSALHGRQPCWTNVVSIPWQCAEEIKDYLRTRYIAMSEESGCNIDIFGVGVDGKYKYYPYLLVTGNSEREVNYGVALLRSSIQNF